MGNFPHEAFDRYITQTPEEAGVYIDYDGECQDNSHEICEDCNKCHICDEECSHNTGSGKQ